METKQQNKLKANLYNFGNEIKKLEDAISAQHLSIEEIMEIEDKIDQISIQMHKIKKSLLNL